MHHTADAICQLCEKKLLDADPRIAHWFRRVKERFPRAHVSCTWRGKEAQNREADEGRSKLRWPNSKHNAVRDGKPCALAMDLFELRDDKVAAWPWKFFHEISEFLKAESAPIDWGFDLWKWDAPHFQIQRDLS